MGGSRGAGSAPVESVEMEVPAGIGPGLASLPAVGGGEKGSASYPPDCSGPSSTEPPRSARCKALCAWWAWGRMAPMLRRGGCPSYREAPCTGVL